MKTKIRILHIDDNVHDRRLVKDALQKELDEYEIIEADSREKFENYLVEGKFDLVLSDFNILGFDGLQVLEIVKQKDPDLPVIIVTGTGSEEIAIQAMKMGAADYVIKSVKHIQGLVPTIKTVIDHKKAKEDHKRTEEVLRTSEDKFRAIFENNSSAIAIINPDTTIAMVNDAYCQMSGYTKDEVVGMSWTKQIVPDDLERLKEYNRRRIINPQDAPDKYEFKFYKKNGEIRHGLMSVSILKNNLSFITSFTDITERKLAEEALRKSEERFSKAFLSSPTPTAITDISEGRVIDVNDQMTKLFGYTREEMIGHTTMELNVAVDWSMRDKVAAELHKNGFVRDIPFQIYTKSGKVKEVLWSIEIINLGSDNVLLNQLHDITERKEAEEALKKSEERLRKAQMIAHVGNWELDLKKKTMWASEEAVRIYGFDQSNSELPLAAVQAVVIKEHRLTLDESLKKLVEFNEAYKEEFQIKRANDGELRSILSMAELVRASNGIPEKVVGVIQDITDLKLTEEELSKEQYLMHSLLENIPDKIYFKDLESRFLRINKAMADMFGLDDLQKAIGKTDFDFFEVEHAQIAHNDEQEIIKTGIPILGKEEMEIWTDKPPTWVSTTKMPLKDTKGKIIGTFGISRDITEKKKMLDDLIAAKEKAEESDRLKTAFLHNISHEIRTPMNSIVGFSEFLKDPNLPPEKRTRFIDIIIQNSNQLLSIITDIIYIATIDSGQEKVYEKAINLNSILKFINEEFTVRAQKQNIMLRCKTALPDNEAEVITDETKLTQILTNLMGNALKFTSEGYISFGYKIVVESELTLPVLQFYVEDTGIGISAELHDEIFKRFRQAETSANRKYGGSGLGLSISKAYVDLLGGKIWLDSELGKGSTFYFTIPYKKLDQNGKSNIV
jgi:PAS domain S-box-containing protein